MKDLESTIEALRAQLQHFAEEATRNEALIRRYQDRELMLLTAVSLPELLDRLTCGLKESFRVESIELLLNDPREEYRNLLHNAGISIEGFSQIQFLDDVEFLESFFEEPKQPWLGPWEKERHTVLFVQKKDFGSIALLPLARGERLLGCLNLGSLDAGRFQRTHATDLLQHLSTIAAVCLENTLNRERLILSGFTDSLTGLHNRRYLERRLNQEIARAARYLQPLSCLFLDADHFKRINDTHGHVAGDQVLREMARRVSSQLRSSDIATRYGGEEFVVLLPHTDMQEARVLAERIREAISSVPIALDNERYIHITASIGVSETSPPTHTQNTLPIGERLLIHADNALYKAKTGGRNQVVCLKEGDPLQTSDIPEEKLCSPQQKDGTGS
ncbi:MAG TPA: sensor domain-containing diguanylate cyclase [Chromatiales bacterium]|nr:sensor domain-containing diguanylate cyclase [Chromatiales bacterium]